MDTLNLIGAGRLGRTLAALWRRAKVYAIGDVLAATPAGARAAVEFIESGRPGVSLEGAQPADAWMIATPDREIGAAAERLAASGLLRPGDLVFHCSGSQPSGLLGATQAAGAAVASVHPLKTFADPGAAAASFAGTWCVGEGDPAALGRLQAAFTRIGGRPVRIDPANKLLYHAAGVLVCNGLTALMEAGLRTCEGAALPRETALALMAPLARETLENALRLGPGAALTGPVARADTALVERQIAALGDLDPRLAALYRALAAVAADLAARQTGADAAALRRLAAGLSREQG